MSARKFSLAGLLCLCTVAGALSPAMAPARAAPEKPLSNGTKSTLSAPGTLSTPAAIPTIEEASVSDVTDSSATLQAKINPEGGATSYVFEYASAGGAFAPVAEAEGRGALGEGDAGVTVSVHVQTGMAVDTPYRVRVVASNSAGIATGAVVSFTTQPVGSAFSLPDGRAWELVTPANKHGANIEVQGENCCALQAAEDGSRFTGVTFSPLEEEAAGNTYGVQFFSQRATAGGWSTKDISTRDEKAIPTPVGEGSEYRIFSSDLSSSVVQPFGKTLLTEDAIELSPEPTSRTTYLRDDTTGTYEPLVTKQNVSSMVHFGKTDFVGANPSLSSVVFTSDEPLTGESGGLFDWMGGRLRLIADGGELGGDRNYESGVSSDNYQNAVSSDGTHVVWSSHSEIFDTNVVTGATVDVATDTSGAYQFASADGSRILLTGENLTPDSHGGRDLYEYALTSGRLSDVTASLNLGEAADVVSVLGASEDGSYIYFLAAGALAAGATSGANNLYVAHDDGTGWTATFIATLDSQDGKDWSSPGERTSRVSPNGLYLAFMSERSLTGYDNHDAVSGEPDEEVFLYSAAADHLTCPSCNPTGARPHGLRVESSNFEPSLIDGQRIESGRWLAAAVPAWTHYDLSNTDYQSRYLSNSGRLFFDGVDSLVAQDTNGKTDVYEYEPGGAGSCEAPDGCVSLISNGTSNEESVFLEASANGDDVFFATKAKLVPEDTDTAFDVYDAHACSAVAPCTPPRLAPPACTTAEACRVAETPQPAIYGAPASETFSGAGNVAPMATKTEAASHAGSGKRSKAPPACKGKRKRKRAACKRRQTLRHAPAKRSHRANASSRNKG